MTELIAKCGVDCSRCPSYRENLRTDVDRQECSDGWHKYLGFRLSPLRILQCDGCLVPTEEDPVRYYKGGCYIRKCAEKNEAVTCAHCSGFPCEDVTKHGLANTREKVAARLNILPGAIPETDYQRFIEPYESYHRLKKVRNTLSPSTIVEMKSPTPSSAEPFPKSLRLSKKQSQSYRSIHKILAQIIGITGDSYARDTVFKKRKQYMLKLLWTLGRHGDLHETDSPYLAIESGTYLTQMKGIPFYTNWEAIKKRFDILKEFGVENTVIPLTAESWVTPKGGMKKDLWVLRMGLSRKTGNLTTLNALKQYTRKLEKKYGDRAYRYFTKGDLRILGNNT